MIEIMTLISLESKIFYELTMNGYTIFTCTVKFGEAVLDNVKKTLLCNTFYLGSDYFVCPDAITSILLIISAIQDSALPVVLSIKKFLQPKLRLCVLMFITGVILFLQQQRTGCT